MPQWCAPLSFWGVDTGRKQGERPCRRWHRRSEILLGAKLIERNIEIMPQNRQKKQAVPADTNGSPLPNGQLVVEDVADANRPGPHVLAFDQMAEPNYQSAHLEFNPADFLVGGDEDEVVLKPQLPKCPCRNPLRDDFVKVREGDEWTCAAYLFKYEGSRKDLRGTYLLHPRLKLVFTGRYQKHWIFTAITTTGEEFLWPAKESTGRGEIWTQTALEAVQQAKTHWVNVISGAEGWDFTIWQGTPPKDPEWSSASLMDRLILAFKTKYIADLDHPVCQALQLS
jgi:hypothetical protein